MKQFIKKLIPKRIKTLFKKKVKTLPEENCSWGEEYPEHTFYIIRRAKGAGLLSDFNFVLGHLMYAETKGYKAVVDMQNYPNYYKEKKPINGTKNAWEYYFKQPMGFNLSDVKNAKNVILSDGAPKLDLFDYGLHYIAKQNKTVIFNVSEFINKYIIVNSEINKEIDEFCSDKFDNKSILGVQYRGTDYQQTAPSGHQIQPSLDTVIEKIEKLKKVWNVGKIFFISEEKEATQKIINYFNDGDKEKMVITMDKALIENYDGVTATPNWKFKRKNNNYFSGLEYLKEVLILSRCNYLIGGATNGVATALHFNNSQYKDFYIFDLGVFP